MEKARKVCILGSTGSIGLNTLNVVRQHPQSFSVEALSCGKSIDALMSQIEEFSPRWVSVGSEEDAATLRKKLLSHAHKPEVFFGPEGHAELVKVSKPDVVMAAMTGTFGLQATLQAIQQSTAILGLANKEVLVMAGPLIQTALQKSSTQMIPVDSEHSAIFQCLKSGEMKEISKVILTASGGPFRSWPLGKFKTITREQALTHPNWKMGPKITIDSATMMNKGLEYIEAIRLFHLAPSQLEILVHRESIIHSMVEFQDGSTLAQLGISDMKVPISYALSYPSRLPLKLGSTLDLVAWGSLHFESPDFEKFPCLRLAIEAERSGPAGPVVLNAANEVAVEAFLEGSISFSDISLAIEKALTEFAGSSFGGLSELLELDLEVKEWSRGAIFSKPSMDAISEKK